MHYCRESGNSLLNRLNLSIVVFLPSISIVSKSGGLTFEPQTPALIVSAYFLKLILDSPANALKQISMLATVNSLISAIDEIDRSRHIK